MKNSIKHTNKILSVLFAFLFISLNIQADDISSKEIKVSGIVQDQTGVELPGVSSSVKGAIRFAADLKLELQGGKSIAQDSVLSVSNADSAVLYIAMATNFVNYKDISADAVKRNQVYLRNAGKNYSKALQEHIAAYQKYYHRVSLDLGYTFSSL